ncbi:hypothetical protein HPK20_15695 [Vibrio fluvialis]|nr:hypothetical protein [Vibrio fluvialis]QKE35942.1 hypothetical protein HPK20_15695 [Vibrio fluvialis]
MPKARQRRRRDVEQCEHDGDHGDVEASGRQRDGGQDFTNTSVTIITKTVRQRPLRQCDGTFDVAVPADDTTFSVSVATTEDAEYEGDETFTLSGQTATQASAVTGTATITDDGSNGGTDDRPTVSTISSSEVPKARQRRST